MLLTFPYDEWLEPAERRAYERLENAIAASEDRLTDLKDEREKLRTRARVRRHRAERPLWAPN